MRSHSVKNILSSLVQKGSKESECRSYATCWLTLLCVIYQPHKENAVYSKHSSKLSSQKVSEQTVPCPMLQSHLPWGPVIALGHGTEWHHQQSLQGTFVNNFCVCVCVCRGGEGCYFFSVLKLCCIYFIISKPLSPVLLSLLRAFALGLSLSFPHCNTCFPLGVIWKEYLELT